MKVLAYIIGPKTDFCRWSEWYNYVLLLAARPLCRGQMRWVYYFSHDHIWVYYSSHDHIWVYYSSEDRLGCTTLPMIRKIIQILYVKHVKYVRISLRRLNYSNYAPNTPQWVYSVRGDTNRKIKSSSSYSTNWQLWRNPHWLIRFHASISMKDAIMHSKLT